MALIINTAQCQDWYEQNDAFEIKLISLRSYVLFGDIFIRADCSYQTECGRILESLA